ncbi:MAG: protein kinase [Agarilytica sp.]
MTLTIPGYEVFESIGEGGMAEVYRGRHARLDREVALKVMLSRTAKDPTFGDRFIREARIAAKLNHPHIVQIYDVNRFEGTFFLSMEYVKGGDLSKKLRQQLPAADLSRIVRDLCESLDYAHSQGYIHRDIKPGNILFRENGSLALSDFGIARAIHSDTHMTQTGMVVGTPSYMSPEQAQGKDLTGSSDLYSVAVIAFQMVTGTLPYQSESSISVAIKHINEPIPALPEHLAAMQTFFNRALAKAPQDRFENGKSMSQAFSLALSKVKDFTWRTGSDEETEVIERPISVSTHSDFEAFTLERQDVSDLETEVLSSPPAPDVGGAQEFGQTGTVVRPASHSQQRLEADSALSGEVVREKRRGEQTSAQRDVMQQNRIQVLFTQKNRGLIIVGLLLVSLVAGATIYSSGVSENEAHNVLSPGQKIRVAQLLERADENVAKGALLSPLGNNAYENYLAILAISPGDPVATTGLKQISSILAEEISHAIAKFEFEAAKIKLKKLQDVEPNSDVVVALDEALAAAQKDVQNSIEEAVAEAAKSESNGDITLAINQYNTAINLSLNHGKSSEKADAALALIANQLLESADNNTRNQSYDAAGEDIRLAEAALANIEHSELTNTLAGTQQALRKAQANTVLRKKVNSILALAERALAKGKLVSPKNDNAYHYYNAALNLQPGNRAAKSGLGKTLDALDLRAKDQIQNGDLDLAQASIDKIKQRAPGDRRLKQLNQTLASAQKEQLRKQEVDSQVKSLYEKADVYLARNRAKRADKIYRRIALVSPNDPGLKSLGYKIADAYAVLADAEIRKKDWRDVYVWVDLGLKHKPGHKRLLEQKALADKKLKR